MLWWTLQQLKSRDAGTRLKAVETLADNVSPKVAEALIDAFSDPDDAVRKAAAKAIGATRDELYLQPLGRALRDRNELVREAAADTLRQLHCAAAAPALVPLLADVAGPVRWQAARALEALGWEPASGAEAARFDVARGKIEDASAHGVEAVEALASVLQSGAYHQRREAVAALSNIPDARVVKALLLALKDADDQVRSAAAESLCKIADPGSTDALILALNDAHKHVRAVAAEGLGHFGGPRAVEPLLRKLADKQWEVREAVCVALGRTRNERAFDPLVRALKDADREVREAAVRGLGYLGDKRAIGPLLGALVDDQDSVRQLALSTLVILDPRWDRTAAARAAMPQLQEALKHSQYWVRQAAADALARIGRIETTATTPPPGTATEPAITPALAEPAHHRKQMTADVLTGLLADFDQELRQAAAEALGRLGQTSAVAPLARALKDTHSGVRKAAAVAIETLRGKPTPETNLILRGEDFPL